MWISEKAEMLYRQLLPRGESEPERVSGGVVNNSQFTIYPKSGTCCVWDRPGHGGGVMTQNSWTRLGTRSHIYHPPISSLCRWHCWCHFFQLILDDDQLFLSFFPADIRGWSWRGERWPDRAAMTHGGQQRAPGPRITHGFKLQPTAALKWRQHTGTKRRKLSPWLV